MSKSNIDLLIILKNSALIGRESLFVDYKSDHLVLLSFLHIEGLIQSFSIENTKIFIVLRFFSGVSKLRSLKLIYKKVYIKSLTYKAICKIRSDKHLIIFSTDKGLRSLNFCKRNYLGGKALFTC